MTDTILSNIPDTEFLFIHIIHIDKYFNTSDCHHTNQCLSVIFTETNSSSYWQPSCHWLHPRLSFRKGGQYDDLLFSVFSIIIIASVIVIVVVNIIIIIIVIIIMIPVIVIIIIVIVIIIMFIIIIININIGVIFAVMSLRKLTLFFWVLDIFDGDIKSL